MSDAQPKPTALLQVQYVQNGDNVYKVLIPKPIDKDQEECIISDDVRKPLDPIICQVQSKSNFKDLCSDNLSEKPNLMSFTDLLTEFKSVKSLVKFDIQTRADKSQIANSNVSVGLSNYAPDISPDLPGNVTPVSSVLNPGNTNRGLPKNVTPVLTVQNPANINPGLPKNVIPVIAPNNANTKFKTRPIILSNKSTPNISSGFTKSATYVHSSLPNNKAVVIAPGTVGNVVTVLPTIRSTRIMPPKCFPKPASPIPGMSISGVPSLKVIQPSHSSSPSITQKGISKTVTELLPASSLRVLSQTVKELQESPNRISSTKPQITTSCITGIPFPPKQSLVPSSVTALKPSATPSSVTASKPSASPSSVNMQELPVFVQQLNKSAARAIDLLHVVSPENLNSGLQKSIPAMAERTSQKRDSIIKINSTSLPTLSMPNAMPIWNKPSEYVPASLNYSQSLQQTNSSGLQTNIPMWSNPTENRPLVKSEFPSQSAQMSNDLSFTPNHIKGTGNGPQIASYQSLRFLDNIGSVGECSVIPLNSSVRSAQVVNETQVTPYTSNMPSTSRQKLPNKAVPSNIHTGSLQDFQISSNRLQSNMPITSTCPRYLPNKSVKNSENSSLKGDQCNLICLDTAINNSGVKSEIQGGEIVDSNPVVIEKQVMSSAMISNSSQKPLNQSIQNSKNSNENQDDSVIQCQTHALTDATVRDKEKSSSTSVASNHLGNSTVMIHSADMPIVNGTVQYLGTLRVGDEFLNCGILVNPGNLAPPVTGSLNGSSNLETSKEKSVKDNTETVAVVMKDQNETKQQLPSHTPDKISVPLEKRPSYLISKQPNMEQIINSPIFGSPKNVIKISVKPKTGTSDLKNKPELTNTCVQPASTAASCMQTTEQLKKPELINTFVQRASTTDPCMQTTEQPKKHESTNTWVQPAYTADPCMQTTENHRKPALRNTCVQRASTTDPCIQTTEQLKKHESTNTWVQPASTADPCMQTTEQIKEHELTYTCVQPASTTAPCMQTTDNHKKPATSAAPCMQTTEQLAPPVANCGVVFSPKNTDRSDDANCIPSEAPLCSVGPAWSLNSTNPGLYQYLVQPSSVKKQRTCSTLSTEKQTPNNSLKEKKSTYNVSNKTVVERNTLPVQEILYMALKGHVTLETEDVEKYIRQVNKNDAFKNQSSGNKLECPKGTSEVITGKNDEFRFQVLEKYSQNRNYSTQPRINNTPVTKNYLQRKKQVSAYLPFCNLADNEKWLKACQKHTTSPYQLTSITETTPTVLGNSNLFPHWNPSVHSKVGVSKEESMPKTQNPSENKNVIFQYCDKMTGQGKRELKKVYCRGVSATTVKALQNVTMKVKLHKLPSYMYVVFSKRSETNQEELVGTGTKSSPADNSVGVLPQPKVKECITDPNSNVFERSLIVPPKDDQGGFLKIGNNVSTAIPTIDMCNDVPPRSAECRDHNSVIKNKHQVSPLIKKEVITSSTIKNEHGPDSKLKNKSKVDQESGISAIETNTLHPEKSANLNHPSNMCTVPLDDRVNPQDELLPKVRQSSKRTVCSKSSKTAKYRKTCENDSGSDTSSSSVSNGNSSDTDSVIFSSEKSDSSSNDSSNSFDSTSEDSTPCSESENSSLPFTHKNKKIKIGKSKVTLADIYKVFKSPLKTGQLNKAALSHLINDNSSIKQNTNKRNVGEVPCHPVVPALDPYLSLIVKPCYVKLERIAYGGFLCAAQRKPSKAKPLVDNEENCSEMKNLLSAVKSFIEKEQRKSAKRRKQKIRRKLKKMFSGFLENIKRDSVRKSRTKHTSMKKPGNIRKSITKGKPLKEKNNRKTKDVVISRAHTEKLNSNICKKTTKDNFKVAKRKRLISSSSEEEFSPSQKSGVFAKKKQPDITTTSPPTQHAFLEKKRPLSKRRILIYSSDSSEEDLPDPPARDVRNTELLNSCKSASQESYSRDVSQTDQPGAKENINTSISSGTKQKGLACSSEAEESSDSSFLEILPCQKKEHPVYTLSSDSEDDVPLRDENRLTHSTPPNLQLRGQSLQNDATENYRNISKSSDHSHKHESLQDKVAELEKRLEETTRLLCIRTKQVL